jgi:hypothetical protein
VDLPTLGRPTMPHFKLINLSLYCLGKLGPIVLTSKRYADWPSNLLQAPTL